LKIQSLHPGFASRESLKFVLYVPVICSRVFLLEGWWFFIPATAKLCALLPVLWVGIGADPDLNPAFRFNADPGAYPKLYTHVRKSEKIVTLIHSSASFHFYIFYIIIFILDSILK
jgi:hypothetical protein